MTSRGVVLALLAGLLLAPGTPLRAEEPELAPGRVGAGLDEGTDSRIEQRLRGTFAAIGTLKNVEVEVSAGVVELSGNVDSVNDHELAVQLAQQVEGVAAVQSQITDVPTVKRRLRAVRERIEARAWSLLEAAPTLLIALVVLVAFVLLGRFLSGREFLYRRIENPFLENLSRQVTTLAVIATGALIALEILDATALVGAALGAAGVVGLALGFAFRDLVENYIASLLLSVRRPFSPNDHVRIDRHEGKVVRLTSRATHLLTFDGNHVRIPNASVYKGILENFTRLPERRFCFQVGIGPEVEIGAAQAVGREALLKLPEVLDDPEPHVVVDELGDSSTVLRFFGWIDQRRSDYAKARGASIRAVKEAFDLAGMDMPEPVHRIRVANPVPGARDIAAPSGSPPSDNAPADTAPQDHLDDAIETERKLDDEDLMAKPGRHE